MAGTETGRAAAELIGREPELATAGRLLADAAQGRGRVLLLGGTAGIGKTRLAGEIALLAERRGFLTLSGSGRILGQGLAYAPLLEALGPSLSGLDPARRARLTQGLPDLGRLFTELPLSPAPALGDGALERTRLFEAVTQLIGRLARRDPVLLAVDDLHWADTATLELLHYLARGVGDRRLLLIGSYRTDEPDDPPALRLLLQDLRRDPITEELRLAGLTDDAVRALAGSVLDGSAPAPLVETLVQRSAGSPLLVTALIRELIGCGSLIRGNGVWRLGPGALELVPAVVRDLVLGRLRHLAAADRALLELIALAGDAAQPEILADVLGLAPGSLTARLRPMITSGLLAEAVPGPDVVLRTGHPAYAEVAYGELAETERRRLHAAIATSIERHRPDATELLAPHYRGAAGQVEAGRALEVLLQAGRRALAVQAGAEAARYLEAARSHAATLGDDRRTAMILDLLGEAELISGRADAALATWEVARQTHRRLGDAGGVARVCARLAYAQWDQGLPAAALAVLSDGLAADPPDAELIRLREVRARILARMGELDAVEAEADELFVLGRRTEQPIVVAFAKLCRAYRQQEEGDYEQVRQTCREAIATGEPTGDLLVTEHAYRQLIALELTLGRHDQARALGRRSLRLARANGLPTHGSMAVCLSGLSDFLAGRWDGAARVGTELVSLGHWVDSPRAVALGLAVSGLVLAHRGALTEAAGCLAEARTRFGDHQQSDRHVFSVVETIEALLLLERGDPVAALAAVANHGSELITLRPYQLAALGEIQLAAGRPDAALGTAAVIAGLDPSAPYPAALAARLTGLVALAGGDHAAARRELFRAAELFAELQLPFDLARSRLGWADAATDQPEAAVAAAQEAVLIFGRLGARRFGDRARRRLRELGVAPAPPRPPRQPAGGLSPREAEVVQLVAEGLSNAEIARRLVISPRTVTTHLQHVYARLGVGSRVALTRYVLDHARPDRPGGAP
ncbi:helix-turn-helix transcriptional regulator [Microlunatus speluncae]|uniref:helix-turn-helix transcriptional regulator n=1 Tax=Microlunatus speluncae TaxID=2594267 RepID=UPI0013754E1F|nr:AAA family ATPase [Microlunatus speluncae]